MALSHPAAIRKKPLPVRSVWAYVGALLGQHFFYNHYKNHYSDEKEGQPVRTGLLVNPLFIDWCGGGDLNPYALRR
jgi:hypothetical protein